MKPPPASPDTRSATSAPAYAERLQAVEGHPAPAELPAAVVQRWRHLRTMLIQQLDMFETGALTLRSNGVNVSEAAIGDLRRSILEFDELIADAEA